MITDKRTVAEYIESITENRREAMSKLRHSIKNNLPDGFKEAMNKVGIEYAVPHSLYPKGYHVSPELPLPFITIA